MYRDQRNDVVYLELRAKCKLNPSECQKSKSMTFFTSPFPQLFHIFVSDANAGPDSDFSGVAVDEDADCDQ